MFDLPRLLIASPMSDQGKTTLTTALLSALCARGMKPAAFKSGPDFIDPMFHRRVLGLPSHNLDLFMSNEAVIASQLFEAAAYSDIAVIEGAMGYYDGIAMTERASCFDLARATGTPVILVMRPRGAALSAAAVIKGIAQFREPALIKGVILNHCSQSFFAAVSPVITKETGIPVLGYMPEMPKGSFESRHLGLITADEVADFNEKVGLLRDAAERGIDIGRLLEIAKNAPPIGENAAETPEEKLCDITIAVAKDEAFCFYYSETLELFERLGAKLKSFSPLRDRCIPEGASALYLGGGYPELYAERLSINYSMRESVKKAIDGKMPCLAECGGFLYLHERLAGSDGKFYSMAGVIKGKAAGLKRLSHFGYISLLSHGDNLLCKAGETLAAHEYHYWQSENCGTGCYAKKPGGMGWECVHATATLFAGFPHLYLKGNIAAAKSFLAAAQSYGDTHGAK